MQHATAACMQVTISIIITCIIPAEDSQHISYDNRNTQSVCDPEDLKWMKTMVCNENIKLHHDL